MGATPTPWRQVLETYNLALAGRIIAWGSLMVAAPLWVGLFLNRIGAW